MLLISSFKDERSCILFFNRQLWFVKEPQHLGFWLGFRLAIAECDKICPNYPKLKVTIAATRAMEQGVLRWSCPNPHDSCRTRPFRRATSGPAFSLFGAATGGTAALPTPGAGKTWFLCVRSLVPFWVPVVSVVCIWSLHSKDSKQSSDSSDLHDIF